MKKLVRNHRFLLFAALVLTGVLALSCPAHAAWHMTHGTSGHVEREANVENVIHYLGWGLDITQKPGTSNWVHYAVPTLGDKKVGAQYVRLIFRTYSADAWVSDVHVYNGPTKIKEFKGSWSGNKTVTLNLGSVTRFNQGLGISVKINAGVEMMSHRVIFFGAGANFVDQ